MNLFKTSVKPLIVEIGNTESKFKLSESLGAKYDFSPLIFKGQLLFWYL
jgi:hypothetical protein